MAGLYSFIRGIPGKLGVGVADEGFTRSNTLPLYVHGGTPVNRCLAPTRVSYAQLIQDVPVVSPLGLTGLTVHGVPLLGRLAQKGGK